MYEDIREVEPDENTIQMLGAASLATDDLLEQPPESAPLYELYERNGVTYPVVTEGTFKAFARSQPHYAEMHPQDANSALTRIWNTMSIAAKQHPQLDALVTYNKRGRLNRIVATEIDTLRFTVEEPTYPARSYILDRLSDELKTDPTINLYSRRYHQAS